MCFGGLPVLRAAIGESVTQEPGPWRPVKGGEGVTKTREELLARAWRIRREIEQIFEDAEHWNRHRGDQEAIDPDPGGVLRKLLAGLPPVSMVDLVLDLRNSAARDGFGKMNLPALRMGPDIQEQLDADLARRGDMKDEGDRLAAERRFCGFVVERGAPGELRLAKAGQRPAVEVPEPEFEGPAQRFLYLRPTRRRSWLA